MLKNLKVLGPNMWSSFGVLILITLLHIQSCLTCRSKQPASLNSASISCRNITTDNHLPRFSFVLQNNLCPNSDKCLRIKTGSIIDHAPLYYSTRPSAQQRILQGYLDCGGDGVSVTGKTTAFDEFDVTLMIYHYIFRFDVPIYYIVSLDCLKCA